MPPKKKKTLEIVEEIGIISESGNMTKEVNRISWFEKPTVLDIRTWYHTEDGEKKPGKGISLTDDDARSLCKILVELGYDKIKKEKSSTKKKKKVKKYDEDD